MNFIKLNVSTNKNNTSWETKLINVSHIILIEEHDTIAPEIYSKITLITGEVLIVNERLYRIESMLK